MIKNGLPDNSALAQLLCQLNYPDFPVAMGIFRQFEKPAYEAILNDRITQGSQSNGTEDLHKLLNSEQVWQIE